MKRKTLWCLVVAAILAGLAYEFWPRRHTHVLLITLDTTRADRIGCYGYAPARTPVLDGLAESGVLCEQASTVAPLTLPAHASLFTGLYPSENGLRTNGRGRLDAGIPTLAAALKRQGYETGAFVASFVLDAKFGLDQGFDHYDDDFAPEESAQEALHRQRQGASVVDAALDWLSGWRRRPFFCWVHLYDPHFPYRAHTDLFGEDFSDRPYDAEIAYVDRQVGRLLEHLRAQGLDSQTLVVVAGDHGEGLMDHLEREHSQTLYREVMHVPLIFRLPQRLPAAARIASSVTLADVSPTILDICGLPDGRTISGRSIKPLLLGQKSPASLCYGATDEPLLVHACAPLRCVTQKSWKYIRSARPELYDLASDPRERENLAETHPEKVREMEALLADFESRLTERAELEVQLSPAERRTLESLGYVGGTQRKGATGPNQTKSQSLPDIKDMLPHEVATDEAGELIAGKDFDAGIARLRAILQEAPGHARAAWLLASTLRGRGEIEESRRVFEALVVARPESREGHHGLALVAFEQDQIDDAIAEFTKTLEIDPEFGEARFNLAMAHLKAGKPDKALESLNKLLELDASHGAAYHWRAQIYEARGRHAEAAADREKAQKYQPRPNKNGPSASLQGGHAH
jgi:arylsulfatase A-like enzyme